MSNAASILGDSFQIEGSIDGSPIGPVVTAASPANETEVFVGPDVFVRWVDEDSFDVTVENPGFAFDLSLTLSDLQFRTPSGQVVDIIGAAFNFDDSEYGTFLVDPIGNPSGAPRPSDPMVTFTVDSVTVSYGSDWSDQLANDWPVLRFDVQTTPEPGSLVMALIGIASAGLSRRR